MTTFTITVEEHGKRKVATVQHTVTGARRALRLARRRAALYGHGTVRCTPPLPERTQ